ncbi:MAG: VWA domain-containing protein [Chloroflexi bacterium]|nr:VWA domain-containing protein [Chloroflexota bacterium]
MVMRYRYTEWDGTQEIPPLDADEVLDGLTDDLMNFGDLQHALRNLMQRGLRSPAGNRMQGLRDLLQQLRQQRRQALDQFDLGSVFEDIQNQLEEILDLERDTLDERMPDPPPPVAPSQPQDGGPNADGEPSDGSERSPGGAPRGTQTPGSQPQGARGQSQQGGRPQAGSPSGPGQPSEGQSGDGQSSEDQDEFTEMLRNIVERKQSFLDELPGDAAGRMKELQNYEFMDPDAQEKYQQLLESLRQQMMNTFFQDMSQALQNITPEDMERMKDMIRDLNEMMRQRMAGEEPDFDGFMDKYGDLFGDNPPQSLEELLEQMQRQAAAMQNLMDSMPGDMRQQLQDLMSGLIQDDELQQAMGELAYNLEAIMPSRDLRNQYPFRGDEELDLQAAMQLMNQMQDMDELERQLERTQYGGDLEEIDTDMLEEMLGEEARETLDQLKNLLEILEEAGYIRKKGNTWEMTPRGTRKIGHKALAEIYQNLKSQSFGKHKVAEFGRYGERADDTKPYEFGDPFHLDLKQTMMNALNREGPGSPVSLHPDDFEVHRSETLTQTATVLMLDLSWSMALRGSFQAAKKVALALNNLIRMQYPRDSLYLVGFSAYARELKTEELPYVRWDETVLGTNMHHALLIAQQLLAKHKVGTRQIIMISDGEPTAHLERGRSYFAYPPSPITIRETLKEVKHCTQKGIVINTFMLDRNYYLKEFVAQVAKINRGRVFYTTPDQLGEYILVDFVSHKRKSIRSR